MRRKLPLTAQEAAVYAPRLEDLTAQRTRRTDAVAWGAELKQLRAAGLSGCDGLAGGRLRWRARARGGRSRPGGAGARSWAPRGIQQARPGAVMAARCHQSSRPRLSPAYFLAGSSTSMSYTQRAAAAPRTRSSLGHSTPPSTWYCARRQGATSRCAEPGHKGALAASQGALRRRVEAERGLT